MKKIFAFMFVIITMAFCSINAYATYVVDTIKIAIVTPEVGKKPMAYGAVREGEDISVVRSEWQGKLDEKGCFIQGEDYTLILEIEVNEGSNLTIDYSNPKNFTVGGKRASFEYTNAEKTAGVLKCEFKKLGAEHFHCYCGGNVLAGDHTEHKEYNYKPWNGTNSITYTNGIARVYLSRDANRTSTLNVANRNTLYLCLNGHSLTMTEINRVINISSGGTLVLCDCSPEKTGEITGGKHQNGGGIHIGGTLYMFGGTVCKNDASYGGGIWNNYNFYFYGGAVNENKAGAGGGVWNANSGNAEFIMYDGSINNNEATYGGGIWNNDNGNLVIKGGELVKNYAHYGGGVWNQGAKFKMDGGFIYQNEAHYGGGVWNQATMELNGGYVVSNIAFYLTSEGNLACGGGVWNNHNSIIHMTAGEISGNYSALNGGGVWNNSTADFVMEGGLIAGNEAENAGGGVYNQWDSDDPSPGVFRMYNDATVSGNRANVIGGGFYNKGTLEKVGGHILRNSLKDGSINDIYNENTGVVREASSLPTMFIDVPQDAYYLQPVVWGVDKGIVAGTSDITFSPDDKCNLAQILTFLWRGYGSPTVKVKYEFADVYKSDYFYMPAHWAKSIGLDIQNALYPNSSCSRIAAVYFMWLAEGKPASSYQLPFTDVKSDHPYYQAVQWAVEKGIASGTSATTFSPSNSCTRGQIITFIWRALAK